ncbi:AAC(3) family N-acetyltransferase [Comamonadaceae bacterium G21597-S1]|nr:AAC(3) family N-acetyltransferase [Comamonadaceae bacterium G21597-S1]
MSPLEAVSGLALRYLSPGRMQALRSAYLTGRAKLHPLMRMVHGTFDVADLRSHIFQTVGSDFEILMVHSSVNHMVPMYSGSALDLVKMLMDYCGPTKTLVMPAFYFGDPRIGGAYATFLKQPTFNLKRMPSQMGLATELFRRMPGVVQSRHPVYRVSAYGPLARELVEGHERTEIPSGVGSPFDFMAHRDTCILGIGKTFQVLTQAHHVEGVMGDAFPVPRGAGDGLEVTVIDGDVQVKARLSARGPLWEFDIWKLRQIMSEERLREWRFHHVPMFTTRAADVTSDLMAAARLGKTLYVRPA